MSSLVTALYLTLPVLIGGVLHMVVVRADWFAFAKKPISRRLFGQNKTVRGFLVMPLATILGVLLTAPLEPRFGPSLSVTFQDISPALLGSALGLAYVLAELPNSFLKRRLGIAPGGLPERNAVFFAFVDQADSAVGCAIAYALLLSVPLSALAIVVLIGPVIHLVANTTLYAVGLRARPL